ncbi:MAG: hypothetical protein ACK4JB_12140 [Reyranella sp.]
MPNADSGKHLSLLETINESERPRNKRRGGGPDVRAREREAVALPEAEAVEARSRTAPVARAAPPYEDLRPDTSESEVDATLPELPQRTKRRPLGGIVSFVMCVILPTVIAAIYYYGYASNQYVSKFLFAVRDTSTATSTSQAAQSLTAMVGISSGATSVGENYMVVEYMTSRQAVQDLQDKIDLKKRYSQPDIDFWSRLNPDAPMERFARYWQAMTKIEYDTVQGTSLAEVRAFSPEDAYLIAKTLLSLGEDLINEVAQRPQREAIQYAEAEVKRAEDRLKTVWADLSEFRSRSGVIDPIANLVVSNASIAATIRSTLSQIQTEIAALRKQGLSQNSATIQSLQTKLKATEEQLKEVEGQISKAKQSGDTSIGAIVARYEQLDLERQFAQNMVTSTMQSLEQAKANAAAKRLFITAFVQPAVPQMSTHPNRFVAVLTVASASLLLWTISLLLSRSIKEHLN